MCEGDDHLARKHPVSLEACRGLRTIGGYDRFCQGSFNPPIFYLIEPPQPYRLAQTQLGFHSYTWVHLWTSRAALLQLVRLPSPQSHFGMIRYGYQFEYTWVICLITFQLIPIELPLYNVSSSVSVFIGVFFVPSLDSPSWTRFRGRLTRESDQPNQRVNQRDMVSQVVTIDQFVAVMASIQEVISQHWPDDRWAAGPALGQRTL